MANESRRALLTALVLCHGPHAQLAEELREGGGQVVGVQVAGSVNLPGLFAPARRLTEAGPIGRITMSAVWRAGDAYRFILRKGEPV